MKSFEWVNTFRPSLYNEYAYCPKLFWLHFNNIKLFEDDQQIKNGSSEHSFHADKESKNPWNKYDELVDGVLVEYTKQKKNFDGKIFQLLIYMIKSEIEFGEIRDTNTSKIYKSVTLNKENIENLKKVHDDMIIIIKNPIPTVHKNSKCERCSFFEFCWSSI